MGVITNIQRFSVHDGPGIRTTVFFKGCNLKCRWCHNPETISPFPQMQYFPERCVNCMACVEVCPAEAQRQEDGSHIFHRSRCRVCGACADVCMSEAMVATGRQIDADEVLRIVERDIHYYEDSGGGVTLSGGEPLLQPEFAADILRGARARGIHTAVDTAANVAIEVLEAVLQETDLVLLDIKCMDSGLHREYTGVSNKAILKAAGYILESGVPVEVRVPVVGGVNDTEENARQTAAFLKGYPSVQRVKLLPYHAMGQDKAVSLGAESRYFKVPEKNLLETMTACFKAEGLDVSCVMPR